MQDCTHSREGTKQLYANIDSIPFEYYEHSTSWATNRNQRAHLLRCVKSCCNKDSGKVVACWPVIITDKKQSLPLASDVKRINTNGVAALAKDVHYLSKFVQTLQNPILEQNLEELQQTVALMQSENSDEYYDVLMRNKKYGRVDAMNGPVLLEK